MLILNPRIDSNSGWHIFVLGNLSINETGMENIENVQIELKENNFIVTKGSK